MPSWPSGCQERSAAQTRRPSAHRAGARGVLATGRPLSDWHAEKTAPLLDPAQIVKLFVSPDRAELYARIDARFDAMLTAGALDEVKQLATRHWIRSCLP